MFEPFMQIRSGRSEGKGTGLGLAISRQFARLMDGDLTVESVEGEGSTFRLEIPLAVVDESEVPGQVHDRRVKGLVPGQSAYRILVVEDGEDNRLLLHKLLEPVGFEVREAVDGQQGIEVWEAWSPQLITMDMRMPVVDGYEATRRIKATDAGQATKILALTASAFEEDRQQVMAAGCDDFVRKPFTESDLLERIALQLGARYEYEEEEADVGTGPDTESTDTGASLATISAALRRQIHDAAAIADGDTLLELAAQIRAGHADDAAALERLVQDYAFDQLMALTRD